jgi:triacylglycerol lipase
MYLEGRTMQRFDEAKTLGSAGRAMPRLAAPIVLVHGFCGFDRVYALRRTILDYFPGVREQLVSGGNRVYVARVSPTAGVAQRAGDLKRFLKNEVPAGPVHIIGHSMGGLDARYMVSRLGMESRVLSLTTIATPHRGTSFADWIVRRFGQLVLPFLGLAGVRHHAFFDLTTESCARFNEAVPDVPGLRYYAIAGRCERPLVGAEWLIPYTIVNRREGPNDGVVSVASATWGEHTEIWAGDHLNLVNWPNRIAKRRGTWGAMAPDFGRIVRRLAVAGF